MPDTIDAKRPTSVQVIDRMAKLLSALAAHDEAPGLRTLAGETGLHPSTALRILTALAEHGFVERSEAGRYQLGVKLLELGSRVEGRLDIRREAMASLEWLRDELRETVNLVLREGDEVVYVSRATPNRMMRVEQVIGGHAPLHCTAAGKLFLADSGADACRDYALRTQLKAYTVKTITDPAALWQNVESALRQGYALDNEEAEQGVGCIGVPIRDRSGRMIAGISISAPIERRQIDGWLPRIVKVGRELSARLGYVEPENQQSGI
jgi:DNA-binding IclR family transcriptional regulator